MVLTFSNFVLPEIFKIDIKTALMKTITIVGTLPKAVPESMFLLTDLAVRLLVGFSKPDMTVNILSASSLAYQKGLHSHNRLTETR